MLFSLLATSLLPALFCIAEPTTLKSGREYATSSHSAIGNDTPVAFTAMTFNIWNCGANVNDGAEKIARYIELSNVDVVALQEVEPDCVISLKAHLSPLWTIVTRNDHTYPNVAIASKFPVWMDSLISTNVSIGVKMLLTLPPPQQYMNVSVWSLHLDYRSYGPYAACSLLVDDEAQIMAGEYALGYDGAGRVQNVRDLLVNAGFESALAAADDQPVVVMGDMNSASALDWNDDTKDIHCDWSIAWPASKLLLDVGELKDSYRTLFPDVRKHPGATWSTVNKFSTNAALGDHSGMDFGMTVEEPQDRIDHILYRGRRIKPTASRTYTGEGGEIIQLKPYHGHNTWPSDHRAVITQFTISNQI